MKDSEAARWFKTQFQKQIKKSLAGTPFSVDLLTAIAMQETGYLWRVMVEKKLSVADILLRCVGDTIDAPSRGAFPKNKDALLASTDGREMFDIAREALLSSRLSTKATPTRRRISFAMASASSNMTYNSLKKIRITLSKKSGGTSKPAWARC
jgi:hypothetical protein